VTQEIAGVRRDDLAAWHDRALHAARNEPKSSLGHALHKFEKHVYNSSAAETAGVRIDKSKRLPNYG